MARKRIEGATLKSWEEVDSVLKQIVQSELEIETIEAQMNKELAEIKSDAEIKARPFKDKIKVLEIQVKEFVTLNKLDLDGKSKELDFGKTGFRKSTKVVLPKVVDKVIEMLKRNQMFDCIVTKETVNKDILKTYDEDVILRVGGSVRTEDTFWYETKREKLQKNK